MCVASGAYSVAMMLSTGSMKFTPLALAFSIMPLAFSMLSLSSREVPTSLPMALKKVYAMPPPMMTVSHLSMRLLMTPILSETFAPPRMATRGRFGFSSAPPMNSISFWIRKPTAEGR